MNKKIRSVLLVAPTSEDTTWCRTIGTVIEDRRPLGVDGPRLMRIRLELSGVADPIEAEVRESQLSVTASQRIEQAWARTGFARHGEQ